MTANCAHQLVQSLSLAVLLSLPAEAVGEPVEISSDYRTGDTYMHIRLLGSVRILNTPVNGFAATELSGIAWDEDAQLLYAVSDAGHLVHLRPQFREDVLVGAELLTAYPLLGRNGKKLPRYLSDAEGLAIRNPDNDTAGDAELLISFEGTPRIDTYSPDGRFLDRVPLPEALRRGEAYACPNCQLEAIALHPALGVVMAPQRPLRSGPAELHSLYDEHGRRWLFPPIAERYCAVVSLETAADGSLLVLERRYKNIFSPITFAVRRVRLDPAKQPEGATLAVEEILKIDNSEGWRVDNFEGIAHHRGQRYFMVSDDGNSALQSTLLVYFEILQ